MAKAIEQGAHASALDEQLGRVAERTRVIASEASPLALGMRPTSGGWTVAETFEHLVISTGSYLVMLRERLGGEQAGSGDVAAEDRDHSRHLWKPTFMGGLLARSLRSRRRLPAPRSWRVVAAPRPAVMASFLEQIEETRSLLRRTRSLDWRAIRLHSPVSRLIRFDLGDCLTIMTVHATRHIEQAERILAMQAGAERQVDAGRGG